MSVQIQFRRGSSTEWTTINPILAEAEMGVETDTNKFKIGDGVSHWSALAYGGLVGPQGPQGPSGGLGTIQVESPLTYDEETQTLSLEDPITNIVINAGNF